MVEKQDSAEVVADNIRRVLKTRNLTPKELSKQCKGKPSARYIANIINREHTPTLVMIDGLAQGLKISSWQLLIPDFDFEQTDNGTIQLLDNYKKSSIEGKEFIMRIAEKESKYSS